MFLHSLDKEQELSKGLRLLRIENSSAFCRQFTSGTVKRCIDRMSDIFYFHTSFIQIMNNLTTCTVEFPYQDLLFSWPQAQNFSFLFLQLFKLILYTYFHLSTYKLFDKTNGSKFLSEQCPLST